MLGGDFVLSIVDIIAVDEGSSGGSDDISRISTNSLKYDRPRNFGGPIWFKFKTLKFSVSIQTVHIFDLIISPKFFENITTK